MLQLPNLIEAMEQCYQTPGQNIYQHGLSVRDHLQQILCFLQKQDPLEGWRIPSWLASGKEFLFSKILSWDVLETYTVYHDVGKPFCRTVDADGKQHFPDHAQVSERIWLENGGDAQVGRLIGMDMDIHTIKAVQVPEFASRPEAISLLLTGLAEVHSNAKMFGGIESTSFKIKFGQIDKRGNAIIKELKNESR